MTSWSFCRACRSAANHLFKTSPGEPGGGEQAIEIVPVASAGGQAGHDGAHIVGHALGLVGIISRVDVLREIIRDDEASAPDA